VQKADSILTLTDQAMDKFQSLAGEGSTIFYDTTLMKTRNGKRLNGQPFTDMASKLGNIGTANIIALAYMMVVDGMARTESLAAVVKKHFSGKMLEMNLKAIQVGIDLASQ
jgi:2-oxoglutarate ferredoxin oxidoreductase subunit gamma